MKYFIPLFFLFFATFESCRKDVSANPPVVDTLFPKPYLPIYPGSWWQYINLSDSSTFTESAGPYIIATANYNSIYHTKTFWVPTWNGVPHFGYGFNITNCVGTSNQSDGFTFELKEEAVGQGWQFYESCEDERYPTEDIDAIIDSVNIAKTVGDTTYTNVMVVQHYSQESTSGFYYFAKNVGLIEKHEWGYSSSGYFNRTVELQHYHINH